MNDQKLEDAMKIRKQMENYRDNIYIGITRQLDEDCADLLNDNLGNEFVKNCSRDIAGEVVRNCFQTSDYYITVDQLAKRIITFKYDDEYDPLGSALSDEQIRKNVFNSNELKSDRLEQITTMIDDATKNSPLFEVDRDKNKLERDGKKNYRQQKTDNNGDLYDELTGKKETKSTYIRNGKEVKKSDLQADHISAYEAARYNSRYVTETGKHKLQQFFNGPDNMQIIHASANSSKSDIRVCLVDGKIKGVNARSSEYDPATDITYKATPEQLADAICNQWESIDEKKEGKSQHKIQTLKDNGYLDEDGKVPASVRKKLIQNIRHSQNEESKVIIKNTNYGKVSQDALSLTKSSVGKVIAGQILYYAAPPLVYETRCILENNKDQDIDGAIKKLEKAGKRICKYIFEHIKDIFSNIAVNSLKNFIKSFMDILINTIKATIKKMFKMAKNLVLSTVDAVRIIADKNSTKTAKADAVFNLFGVTITSCVVEVLFELLGDMLHIPEPFDDIVFGPLQILTTIVCTNLTMLVLKKLDLFGVSEGLKITQIRNLFNEAREEYDTEYMMMTQYADYNINEIIGKAKNECIDIYYSLQELDYKNSSVRNDLQRINNMFSMNINFEEDWLKFIGENG